MISVAVLAVILDQAVARMADNSFVRNDQFFQDILEDANLEKSPNESFRLYMECETHQKFILYYSKTCFTANGGTNIQRYGNDIVFVDLLYWPPLSIFFRPLSSTYYNDACCRENVYRVTREKEILKRYLDG
jgi:hypothetical protein